MDTHIVILGAGYAGLRVALGLDKLLPAANHQMHITLVDQYPYHQHICLLHLAATNAVPQKDVAVPLSDILKYRPRVHVHSGYVTQIQPLQRQVILDKDTPIAYDRLVIALGALTDYHGVEGADEHTFPLRSYEQALVVRDHIEACFAQAAIVSDPAERRLLLTTAIVGGGLTGCQFAGEMAVWASKLCQKYYLQRSDVRIALIETDSLLIGQLGEWATREAEDALDRRGVSVYLNTNVERVEPRTVFVSGNRMLRAGTIVWAGGIRAPRLLADSGLPTDAAGRVHVDRYLRVEDQAHIFAIGDCAHVPGIRTAALPATASYAMREGEHLAQSLIDEMEGRPPRPYEPAQLGLLVSLGPSQAVGNPLGVPIYGPPAATLKQGVEYWYLTTLS
ncbi:MAG: NAD(P)/FAD-dependent oxidoreductase [Chloroflexaceae bacterium]|nr:NAD(P)/FAD-dependent oxidoreductase [Chloroflexaceae bacterium]